MTQPHDTPPVEVALGLPGNGVNPRGLYAWGEGCDGQDCTTSTISTIEEE